MRRKLSRTSLAAFLSVSAGFDPTAKEYFERILSAAHRMGQLIDDMLDLSRVTRSEMRHEQVNLTEIAETVISELRHQDPRRKVECVVARDYTRQWGGFRHDIRQSTFQPLRAAPREL